MSIREWLLAAVRRFGGLAVASALAMSAPGCAYQQQIEGVELPLADPQPQGRVVVTDFYNGQYEFSVTQSQGIETLRESMEVKDISPMVAQALKERGINAVARKNFDAGGLAPNEVLLRGIRWPGPVKDFDEMEKGIVAKILLASFTACLIGCVVSWPHRYGCGVKYRVELVDAAGNFMLAGTENKFYQESYKTYTFGHRGCQGDGDVERADVSFYDALAASIGTATNTPPPAIPEPASTTDSRAT
jgi:hypothetical protein